MSGRPHQSDKAGSGKRTRTTSFIYAIVETFTIATILSALKSWCHGIVETAIVDETGGDRRGGIVER